ncbi:MAG TPA: aminotransferase class I/II-fold pyridoxal phosphate-dependent enzyme [Longimicrobiaceae bacterium]|nr:aminotransferase class I/II-fold pyridoxal phosphate-dependent enzyme [Longimicrobiaceae bacterium]
MKIPDKPLEPDAAEIRAMTARVVELLIEKFEKLDDAPASENTLSADLLAEVSRPPPDQPQEDLGSLLARTQRAAAASYETAGPSYLAYIPGGGIFTATLAEFLASGFNRYTGRATPAPGFVALEQSVLRWMCDIFRFPAGSQGLLTTGGSVSNLIALATARTHHAEGRSDLATVYVGEHAHGSLAKAARTIGIARDHIRTVRSTPDLCMDIDHLRSLIEADREAGLIPACICAAAGTTNTGTLDPLDAVAALAEELDVWFHVDGAYGGFFQLTERGRERLSGIDRADSITLDPHKSLFLPFGTGALVVRSADTLRHAFTEEADYMQDLGAGGGLPDFDTLSPELTREFRGLRLWLPLHLHGVDAFRRELNEKLDLTEMAYEALSGDDRFEVPWTPDLTVIAFRLVGADDAAQLAFLRRINASQRVLLSSTRIGGTTYLRIAILSFRTHEDRIKELLEIISRAADELS